MNYCCTMLLAASLLAANGGCHKTLSARVVQPNPLCQPLETLRQSETADIVTGDHELRAPEVGEARTGSLMGSQAIRLHNKAAFKVVSRDRLRFRLQVEHKWREWADISGWRAYLIDDRGRRYEPEHAETGRNEHVVSMWDYETRSAVRDRYGDITHVNQDGHKDRKALGSVSYFRGNSSLAFYARDLFTSELESLTLVLERPGMSLRWTWRFTESAHGNGALASGCDPGRQIARVPE